MGNAKSKEGGNYISLKCLNDMTTTTNWKKDLVDKKGSVLATEIKNNSFKFARWIGQAWLSGCDMLKLGYVTRINNNDPYNHEILCTHTHHVKDLADQMSLH